MNSAEYNILEYGAVPGGNKINTKAVQAAVDTCAENGGGRVLVPAGTFLTGTIFLKDNVELHPRLARCLRAVRILQITTPMTAFRRTGCSPPNR